MASSRYRLALGVLASQPWKRSQDIGYNDPRSHQMEQGYWSSGRDSRPSIRAGHYGSLSLEDPGEHGHGRGLGGKGCFLARTPVFQYFNRSLRRPRCQCHGWSLSLSTAPLSARRLRSRDAEGLSKFLVSCSRIQE